MRLFGPKDVDKTALRRARIAILGYGSQGRAHALNLKDSGFDVVVGVRKGDSFKQARKDGLTVMAPIDAVQGASLVAFLVPDTTQKALYAEVKDSIEQGATLLFAHGFNIHFGQIKPRKDLDVVLIAPKGPGGLVRRQFRHDRGGAESVEEGLQEGAGLCPWHRQHPWRRAQDHLRRRDRDRSVRRAGGAVRRHVRPHPQGFRDAGGSRLPARGGLLRSAARTE